MVCELTRPALERLLPEGWHIRNDRPLRIPKQASVPEPDLVITRGSIRDYLEHHPEPADVALVVEVSDSSLAEDRKLCLRLCRRRSPGLLDRQPDRPPGRGLHQPEPEWLPIPS